MTSMRQRNETRDRQISSTSAIHGVTKWALSALLATGVVSLLLAMAGLLQPWLAWPLAAIGTVILGRHLPAQAGDAVSRTVAVIALSVVTAVTAVGLVAPHEHFLGVRDPGTYVATGAWLARTGSLEIPLPDEFEGVPVVSDSVGFPVDEGNETLKPQFLHVFPAVLGLVGATFGLGWMFLVNPVIGGVALLGVFVFARRVLSQWSALAAMSIVAVSLPFLYFSRAPFTEPMALAFGFGGLWALDVAMASRNRRWALAAGLLLGGTALTRIDGIIVLIGVTAYLSWVEMQEGDAEITRVAWSSAAFVAVVGLADGLLFSPVYIADHGEFLGAALAAILVMRVGAATVPRLGSRNPAIRNARWISNAVVVTSGTWLLYAATLRPGLEAPTRADIYGISGLQNQAGVTVEPLRTYAELSVHWLSWYLGVPILLLGLVGLLVITRRAVQTPTEHGMFAVITLVASLTYLYRPSINPDHIWAMRRFLPWVVPAIAITALILIERSQARWRFSNVVAGALIALMMVPVVVPTARAGLSAEFQGGAADVASACATLGAGSALLIAGANSEVIGNAVMPVLRGWCGIPVARVVEGDQMDSDDLRDLAAELEGRRLWLVGGSEGGPGSAVRLFFADYRYLEGTLFRAPSDWQDLSLQLNATRIGPA